ncbi:MAG: LLM class flavin-dependent oxidoreductase [Candidatus Latescibacterota bacterium]
MNKPVRFGFCPPIFAAPGNCRFRAPNYAQLDAQQTIVIAQKADVLGYDSLWVADHLMLGKDEAILEGWTTLAALAGSTKRAQLGLIHQSNLMRNPALAAKMAATLDQISGGRLVHFFDMGNNAREHQAYGLPWSDEAETRVAMMEEALALIIALWTETEPLSHQGKFYTLEGAICRPQPLQKPHPPIWIGEAKEGLLDLCAQHAQGWNSVPVGLAELERRLRALEAACRRRDRDMAEIEKSYETQILVASSRSELRELLCRMVDLDASAMPDEELKAYLRGATDVLPESLSSTFLMGTPDEVEIQIRAYVDLGIDHFMLWFMDAPDDGGLSLFADEVIPRFR